MSNDTDKKDALEMVIESGQLQMAIATETLGLVKAFNVEGESMLEPRDANLVVIAAFINAFRKNTIATIRQNIENDDGRNVVYPSLAKAVEGNVVLLRQRRADEKRTQNEEMAALMKSPAQKPVS